MAHVEAIFFDLFYTLIKPVYLPGMSEIDLLGVSADVWEAAAEADDLYRERALGIIIDPTILDTLRRLHNSGIKLGLISNADCIDKMYWAESPLWRVFDDVIFSCDVGLLKPDPRIYKLAADRMSVKPVNALFVGDGGTNELTGAHCAGMKTVWTEHIEKKEGIARQSIQKDADYHVIEFTDLLSIVTDESNCR